jgi:HEAT repeat protein
MKACPCLDETSLGVPSHGLIGRDAPSIQLLCHTRDDPAPVTTTLFTS